MLKSFQKKAPECKKLFPEAKAFEGRKFEHAYVSDRKQKLQKFLDSILAVKELHTDEELIKWLGLQEPEDPKFAEVFDVAFTNTKWRLWIWKRIPYDEEEEAIAKLVIEEIKREMWSDIVSGLPNQAKVRQMAIQAAYKTIAATVGPVVQSGWKLAKEALNPLKPIVADAVDNAIDKLLDVEDEIKKKLVEAISQGLEPIVAQLSPILGSLTQKLLPGALAIASELAPSRQLVLKKLDEIVASGDEKAVEEIGTIVKEKREEAEAKVNEAMQKQIEAVVGELSGQITIEALSSFFSPLQKLVDVVNCVFDLCFNPTPQIRCIQTLCEWRAKLETVDISNLDDVEDLLDREESWLMWRRWWSYWDYRYKAWSIYYHTWGISELVPVAQVFRDYAFKFAVIQKKWIKRWSYRFGDHLHERAKKATQQNWKDTVRECFAIGYAEANDYFRKKNYELLYNMVHDFFFNAIGVKVEGFLMKTLGPVIDPLSKVVPPPLNEVLEVDTIARESINKALRDALQQLVDKSIVSPIQQAWASQNF